MHGKRWITAIVALPLLIMLILKGGPALFAVLIAVVATLALKEYFGIVYADHEPAVPTGFTLWSYGIGAALILTIQDFGFKMAVALLAIHLIGAGILSVFRFGAHSDAPVVAVKQVFGVLYVSLFLAFAVLLYNAVNGVHWVFLVLVVVAAGDTGAYYVGSYLGRHKLCPAVSPKKTVEGAVGGIVANIVVAVVYESIFLNMVPLPSLIVFAVMVGAVGQVGDLFESEFKRVAGVKDSGKLLPGHGGFLDRIDALLFALPTAYFFKEYVLS